MSKGTPINPLYKLAITIIISGLSLVISFSYEMDSISRVMIVWDVFAFSYLTLSWITFHYLDIKGIQHVATKYDKNHRLIFFILLPATIFSLFVILLLLKSEEEWNLNKGLVALIYFLGIFFSWMLLHTIYTFRYAHLFYGNAKKNKEEKSGLEFPGENNPNYIDFAYFSFVIGMTFQVADVSIHSRLIRRNVLLHSLLSFGFNVVIISICVNAIVNI